MSRQPPKQNSENEAATSWQDEVDINPEMLDVEELRQPKLVMKYGEMKADLKRELAACKKELEFQRAKVADSARLTLPKATVDAVKDYVTQDSRIQELESELIELQHSVDVCGAVLSSLDDRKNALQDLTKLHGQQYFAGPSAPHDMQTVKKGLERTFRGPALPIQRHKQQEGEAE
ncbi:MAG: hypothetical protein KJ556_20180 [Gammaproteobacteria bacterium]|nr:hypothetical protein [Gammaproteobacteria bacterium]